MGKIQGLKAKDYSAIRQYAELHNLVPGMSDVVSKIIYFRPKDHPAPAIKVPLSHIYEELTRAEEQNEQA